MVRVSEEEREHGRRAIHQKEVTFAEWLGAQNRGAVMDIGNSPPASGLWRIDLPWL